MLPLQLTEILTKMKIMLNRDQKNNKKMTNIKKPIFNDLAYTLTIYEK